MFFLLMFVLVRGIGEVLLLGVVFFFGEEYLISFCFLMDRRKLV